MLPKGGSHHRRLKQGPFTGESQEGAQDRCMFRQWCGGCHHLHRRVGNAGARALLEGGNPAERLLGAPDRMAPITQDSLSENLGTLRK